jgi:hypothetical protein
MSNHVEPVGEFVPPGTGTAWFAFGAKSWFFWPGISARVAITAGGQKK